LFFVTKSGQVKKTAFDAYNSSRRDGLIALGLKDDDELVRVIETSGTDDIFMVARSGQTIRFSEEDVRPMGRAAAGVRGVRGARAGRGGGAAAQLARLLPSKLAAVSTSTSSFLLYSADAGRSSAASKARASSVRDDTPPPISLQERISAPAAACRCRQRRCTQRRRERESW
jgi:DNA gyrase/topoisomerase IV subunit A